jgi:hypothetical protein
MGDAEEDIEGRKGRKIQDVEMVQTRHSVHDSNIGLCGVVHVSMYGVLVPQCLCLR